MFEIPEGLITVQKTADTKALLKCNEFTSSACGLILSDAQIADLEVQRFDALKMSGRMEFGTGILPALIYAFAESPYINSKNYFEVLGELQWLFYEAKTCCMDIISDDELIGYMRKVFNTSAQGSVEQLTQSVEAVCLTSVQQGYSCADCCDIEDFSYINHNSDNEGFEDQTDMGGSD